MIKHIELQRAHIVLFSLFILLLMLLSACATMSKKECQTATRDTWVSVGYDDGRHGRPETTIRRHQKSCAGIVSPDLSAYQQGHARGIKKYCVARTGYKTGLNGNGQNEVCAATQFSRYHDGYQLGYEIYQSEQRIKDLSSELQSASQSLADAEYEIKRVEADLVSPGLTTERRIHLLRKAESLRNELPQYQEPVDDIAEQISVALGRHNEHYIRNEFEVRNALQFPQIVVEVKPDPMQHVRSEIRKKSYPEMFVIDKKLSRKSNTTPQLLIRNKIAMPLNKSDKEKIRTLDQQVLKRGKYHLFRFVNDRRLLIHWYGGVHAHGAVNLEYWDGMKFITVKSRPLKDSKQGYRFFIKRPANERYVYVLISSSKRKGKLFTDYIEAQHIGDKSGRIK